jgi:hypothetical protein
MSPKQKEGFALMRYCTGDRSHCELIWNSRDAITPFCIWSRDGREMTHVDWQSDKYLPYHVPEVGDRIFMSMTEDLIRDRADRYVEKFWNDPDIPMSRMYPSKEIAAAHFVRAWVDDWGGESPTVVEVTPELQAVFAQRARAARDGAPI